MPTHPTVAMMNRICLSVPLLSAGILLSGCGPQDSLNNAQATCTATNPSFVASWQCIRSRVAAGTAGQMNNSPAIRYMATGDLLAERVRNHQVTDIEARAQLATELQQAETAFLQQRTLMAAGDPIVCNRFGTTTVCN